MKATHGRIWEAASKDDSRPILNCVHFDAKAATLTATNSYILARVPCEVEDGDESGLIPAVALKEAKGRSLSVRDGKATLHLPGGERSWYILPGAFPDVDKLLKPCKRIDAPYGFNPDLLADVAHALGAGGRENAPLVVHPWSPLKPTLVEDPRGESVGILMPVRLNQYDKYAGERLAPTADWARDDIIDAAVAAYEKVLRSRRGRPRAREAFRAAAAAAMTPTENAE